MKKIKIILAIFLAFWISIFLKNTVFLANTPKIRPFLAQHLIESLTNFYQNRFAKKEKNVIVKENKQHFYPITKGIYASETKEKRTILIKENEINWKVYQYEINGKKISIKVPEGQEPPPREVVEKVFK